MGVEQFDQLGEVGERAGQPVDLVDNDDVDPVSANLYASSAIYGPTNRTAPSVPFVGSCGLAWVRAGASKFPAAELSSDNNVRPKTSG
jgi:hypothetical protein